MSNKGILEELNVDEDSSTDALRKESCPSLIT